MAYSWEGAFLKSGASIFDEATVETFRRIQKKYSTDYVPYLDKMIRSVGKDLSGPVKELRSTVQELIRNIGVLLSGKMTGTGSETLVQRIQDGMIEVNKGLKFVTKQVSETKRFGKASELAERLTGVSLQELRQSQEAIGERVAEVKPEHHGLLETIEKKTPKLFEAGKGVAGSLATSLLGPFAGMTQLLGTTGVDIFKSMKERAVAKREEKMAHVLTPMSKEYGEGPLESLFQRGRGGMDLRGLEKVLRGGGRGGHEDIMSVLAGMLGKTSEHKMVPPGAAEQKRAKVGTKEVPVIVQVDETRRPHADKTDVFQFFDKHAHKAKWTRDVLEALKKIVKEEKGAKGMGLMPMINPASLLPFLGALGAGAGAGIMGVVATKLLQKLEDVNKPMRKGIAMMQPFMLGGNLLDPKRSHKLMVEGYSDLNKMLFARLDKPIKELEQSFSKLGNLFKTFIEGAGKKFGQWLFGWMEGDQKKVPENKTGVIAPVASTTTIIPPKPEQRIEQSRTGMGKTVSVSGAATRAAFEEKSSTDIRFEKLMGALEKLVGTLGADKSSGSYSVTKSSRDSQSGTGDTRLDLLNSGSLGLAD